MNRPAGQRKIAAADAFTADHMTVVSCEHGTIWIRLHDAAGKVKAYGCFDPDGALNFADAVMDELGKVVSGHAGSCGSVH